MSEDKPARMPRLCDDEEEKPRPKPRLDPKKPIPADVLLGEIRRLAESLTYPSVSRARFAQSVEWDIPKDLDPVGLATTFQVLDMQLGVGQGLPSSWIDNPEALLKLLSQIARRVEELSGEWKLSGVRKAAAETALDDCNKAIGAIERAFG